MSVLYTSDLHFHHGFVAKLRGFVTTKYGIETGNYESHDEMIITRWNKTVKPTDRVYIAGDFAMNWDHDVEEKLARLNGEKILVWGNHDVMAGNHRDGWKHVGRWIGEGKFAGVTAYARRKIGTREILVSHYPYSGDHTRHDRHTQFRLRDEGRWLIHGHTHSKTQTSAGAIYWEEPPKTGTVSSMPPVSFRNRMIHVGVDAWDFTPVKEQVIVDMMNKSDAAYGWDGKKFPWESKPGEGYPPLLRGET